MFGVKNLIPRGLRTCVVYKFLCADCIACYVGIYQHVCVSTWSVIGPLTFSNICIILHNVALHVLMSILDHASTTFQLKIKEAIHIQWEQPILNHQLHHVNLKLSL